MSSLTLSLQEAQQLAAAVLEHAGTEAKTAQVVAQALVDAETRGQAGHGLSRLPFYAAQVRSGKIDGRARPSLSSPRPATVTVDARCGFAYPAIRDGLAAAEAAVASAGVVAVAVDNSHHFGMAGYHVEPLARKGLVGLALGNSPAAIAPWGGRRPLFGTNPIAFACPSAAGEPLLIDLSLSTVARGKVMLAAREGRPIPQGWATDECGEPTTDASAALRGGMLPMGGAKGAALAMMVELMAAAFTGAHFGFEADSFFSAEGPPPRVGQFFLVLDPAAFGSAGFAQRVQALSAEILAQEGTRLPGARGHELRHKAQAEGLAVPEALILELRAYLHD